MVVNIAWTPIGCAQDGMECANDVDKGIAHQKEEVYYCRDAVHGTHQNAQLSDDCCDDETVKWLKIEVIHFLNFAKN